MVSSHVHVTNVTNVHIADKDLLREFYKLLFLTVFCFEWSVKKHGVAKILKGIWQKFLYEKNRNCNSFKFSCKFIFIPFWSFHRNQNQQSSFQQVSDLVPNLNLIWLNLKIYKSLVVSKTFQHWYFFLKWNLN